VPGKVVASKKPEKRACVSAKIPDKALRGMKIMAVRHLLICVVLGGFFVSTLPIAPPQAEAAQTAVKKKKKKADDKQQQHGKKKYPWGEPNAGWEDKCIFYFDTYDGWIPPFCRPYGRTY
jgi:hypothetical protein